MKKLKISICVLTVMVIGMSGLMLTGCRNRNNYDFTVGINQFLQHPALDLARTNFQSRLNELMGARGYTVRYIYQNANADRAIATTISNNFLAQNVDLIQAIATPSAQVSRDAAIVANTPVVFSAVTSPYTAGLYGHANITGASDALDMKLQVELIRDLLGGEINGAIAYLYTGSEDNSRVQGDMLTTAATEMGIEVRRHSINTITDLQTVMTAIAGDNEIVAIYIGQDNLLAANMQSVANLNYLSPRSLPIVTGDTAMAIGGGIASAGMDYAAIGRAAANLAYEILANGATPGDLEIYYPTYESLSLLINQTLATQLGITIPETLLARADRII
ncbi:MAG: ABC transporter substrate-binding protein [Firmicutes bacterium]|nr:ABC transporter substrate-binding protein [Bacillota bacterium]